MKLHFTTPKTLILFVYFCSCGNFATPTITCHAATVGFDWNLIASDEHPSLEYFPMAAAAPNVFTGGPFQKLQGGLGTANSILGLPTILASVGGSPSNLTFEFGNFTLPLPGYPLLPCHSTRGALTMAT